MKNGKGKNRAVERFMGVYGGNLGRSTLNGS